MSKLEQIVEELRLEGVVPQWAPAITQAGRQPPRAAPIGGVRVYENEPWCLRSCPRFDGKRCKLTGFEPNGRCGPAIGRMAEVLRGLEA